MQGFIPRLTTRIPRYTGSAAHWGFAIYRASDYDYDKSALPTGLPFGTPQGVRHRACGLCLGDSTAGPARHPPTKQQAQTLANFARICFNMLSCYAVTPWSD
jgi:hypothetical protein